MSLKSNQGIIHSFSLQCVFHPIQYNHMCNFVDRIWTLLSNQGSYSNKVSLQKGFQEGNGEDVLSKSKGVLQSVPHAYIYIYICEESYPVSCNKNNIRFTFFTRIFQSDVANNDQEQINPSTLTYMNKTFLPGAKAFTW